jgi:hypothetical protein
MGAEPHEYGAERDGGAEFLPKSASSVETGDTRVIRWGGAVS